MAVDISRRITNHFPRTEALLQADTDIDYATAKTDAIADSKIELYGETTVPSESDMVDVIRMQVADLATIALIPLAKNHYAHERQRSKSNREGENVQYYDLLDMLDELKADLENDVADRQTAVDNAIGSSSKPRSVPGVSHDGPMVNPTTRALLRGLP